jgi:hypothetical protein
MGGPDNQVVVLRRSGADAWPPMSKGEVGERLAREIAEALNPR